MTAHCGNERHPNGPWHPISPEPSPRNVIERFAFLIRRMLWGCGCPYRDLSFVRNQYPEPRYGYSRCWCHYEYEPIPENVYRVCYECGHVYPTPADLELAYQREIAGEKRAVQRTADQIFFCQECIHDF